MSRRKIIDLPGQPHFVTFSTYQRRQFLAPKRTREIVMEVLEECRERHRARCHGFVVMPNHVHVLLTVSEKIHIGHLHVGLEENEFASDQAILF
jgi:REP element-mobilizing transposase RayT